MAIEAVGLIEPVLQFEDGNGIPYAGGSVTFVIVGTSTPQNVYSDPALTVSLGNVVTLNAAGRSSTSSTGLDTPVYLQQLTYDYTLKDANGTIVYGPVTVSGSQWPGQIQGQAITSPAANANGYANRFTTTLNKAGSGTHALFAGTRFDVPTIGAGASTLTEADTVYIEGAPSTGTTKNALHVAAGNAQFDGGIVLSGLTAHGVLLGEGTAPISSTSAGTAGQMLISGGASADPSWQTPFGVIDREVAVQTVSGTSAETAVYTFSVPGGTLSTNKTLHLSLIGDFTNNIGSAITFTVRVKYGATTVYSGALTNVNTGSSANPLLLDCEITAGNATNVQRIKAWEFIGATNSGGAAGAAVTIDFTGGGGGTPSLSSGSIQGAVMSTATEDSTAAKNLVVTFQCSNASGSFTAHAYTVYTELK